MAVITKLQKKKKKPNSLKDRWRTPLWLFHAAQRLVGRTCTIDVACDETNALCSRFLTIKDNSLLSNWGNNSDVAWCNPPYSAGSIAAFVQKAIEQQKRGVTSILLLPASTDTQWYLLAHQFCKTYVVTGKRVQFDLAIPYTEEECEDQKQSSNTGGSMILFFDGNNAGIDVGTIIGVDYNVLHSLGNKP